jgi:hypothetical protein
MNAPGVHRPDQTPPADLGDGLRARVEELEQRIAAAVELCDLGDASADRHGVDRLDVLSSIRHALRGDQ